MILANSIYRYRLFSLFLLLSVVSCGQNTVGSLSGTVTSGDTTSQININFSSISFPSDTPENTLAIRLTNVSGDSVTFVLNAKSLEASTLTGKFPVGEYLLDPSSNSFTGSVTALGTQSTDISASNGVFTLQNFQIGVDANGAPAVGIIQAAFEITLAEGGSLTGSLDKDFT